MALFLFAFWVVLNGRLQWDVLVMGAAVTGVILLFACQYLEWSLKRERAVYRMIPDAAAYVLLLLEEIVKANVCVLRLLAKGKTKPVIRTIKTSAATRMGRVLLANSITLTPGTITLRCEGDMLTVHCLDESLAEGLEGWEIEKKILKLEETLHG